MPWSSRFQNRIARYQLSHFSTQSLLGLPIELVDHGLELGLDVLRPRADVADLLHGGVELVHETDPLLELLVEAGPLLLHSPALFIDLLLVGEDLLRPRVELGEDGVRERRQGLVHDLGLKLL